MLEFQLVGKLSRIWCTPLFLSHHAGSRPSLGLTNSFWCFLATPWPWTFQAPDPHLSAGCPAAHCLQEKKNHGLGCWASPLCTNFEVDPRSQLIQLHPFNIVWEREDPKHFCLLQHFDSIWAAVVQIEKALEAHKRPIFLKSSQHS